MGLLDDGTQNSRSHDSHADDDSSHVSRFRVGVSKNADDLAQQCRERIEGAETKPEDDEQQHKVEIGEEDSQGRQHRLASVIVVLRSAWRRWRLAPDKNQRQYHQSSGDASLDEQHRSHGHGSAQERWRDQESYSSSNRRSNGTNGCCEGALSWREPVGSDDGGGVEDKGLSHSSQTLAQHHQPETRWPSAATQPRPRNAHHDSDRHSEAVSHVVENVAGDQDEWRIGDHEGQTEHVDCHATHSVVFLGRCHNWREGNPQELIRKRCQAEPQDLEPSRLVEDVGLLLANHFLITMQATYESLPDCDEKMVGEEKTYVLYKSRWLQVLWFCLASLANQFLWIAFSPIVTTTEKYYGVGSVAVNMLSLSFMIAYPPFVLVAGYVLDNMGYRFGMSVGIVMSIAGAWLRGCGGPSGFWLVMLGQCLAAVGQPFVLNATAIVAANWFPPGERTLATTICSIAAPIGAGIGFLVPPALLSGSMSMRSMLLIEAGIATALMVLPLVFVRSKPPSPPSASQDNDDRGETMLTTLRVLFTDFNFVLLLIVFGLSLGTFNSLATLLGQIVSVFGYTDSESGNMGAIVICMGIVGSGILGAIVEKTHLFKTVLLISTLGGTLALLWLRFELVFNNFGMLCVACSFLGFLMTPILPLCFELVCETTFPIREAVPSGILISCGQIVGIALTLGVGGLINSNDPEDVYTALYIFITCVGAGFMFLMPFAGKLKRIEHEAEQKSLLIS
eukprot:TRINITY_DN8216_c0_g1_i1.p2 TRINITY_DN8216_c0_g1~~TRINITY_DN8216_c0_g1_i1.p2  ORF type:complete len:734 (-),score=126.68 TRINITY_DN8216_c0_g1_i1:14-2215(-)